MFGRMILTSSVHYCDLDPQAVGDHSEFYKNCRSHDLLEKHSPTEGGTIRKVI